MVSHYRAAAWRRRWRVTNKGKNWIEKGFSCNLCSFNRKVPPIPFYTEASFSLYFRRKLLLSPVKFEFLFFHPAPLPFSINILAVMWRKAQRASKVRSEMLKSWRVNAMIINLKYLIFYCMPGNSRRHFSTLKNFLISPFFPGNWGKMVKLYEGMFAWTDDFWSIFKGRYLPMDNSSNENQISQYNPHIIDFEM